MTTTRLEHTVASPADFAVLRRRFGAMPMQPKLLRSREEGIDISSPGRESFTLLVGEETGGKFYSGEVRLMPGFGAPPHHQPTEDELWYLLDGELDVRVGHRRATLKPGAFAYIPRETTHAFRNNTSTPVRLLTWNSPGGHERAFESMRALAARGITAFPQLKDMFLAHEIVMHADEAESTERDDKPGPKLVSGRVEAPEAAWPGGDAKRLLSGAESGGDFDVFDVCLQRGAALASQVDANADKCFYVLAGRADVRVGSAAQQIERGAFAYVPRGTAMSITDAGGDPIQFLMWRTPATTERSIE